MKSRLGALAVALLVSCAGIGKGWSMEIQQFELKNGMKVLVVPDHRVPVVTHSVWYRVGALDEVPGKTGLAHMTEHLMFKGTERYPMGEMDKIVQRKGGIQNAFTSYDFTGYFQKVPLAELPQMMDIESDRMVHLKLNDAVFQPERKVVAEERKLTTDSNPTDRFYEEVMRRHFAHHTYGHPIIGWAKDIQGYTFEDAVAWYKRHYAPNNAVMVLVGDITAKEAKPLVEKYYGPLKPVDVPPRVVPVEPSRDTPLSYVKVDAQVQVPVWNWMFRAPSMFAGVAGAKPDADESIALWVLSEIVGGADTARMYQELVVKQKIADAASTSYDSVNAGESHFSFNVQPKHGVTADKIRPAVDKLVADLLKDGVTEEELAKAKTTILADEIYARDDAFNTVYRLGIWVTAGGDPDKFDAWQDTLKKMTVDDVNAVARKYLVEKHSTLAVLVGKKPELGSLKPTTDK